VIWEGSVELRHGVELSECQTIRDVELGQSYWSDSSYINSPQSVSNESQEYEC
jgi:hypothetical protein